MLSDSLGFSVSLVNLDDEAELFLSLGTSTITSKGWTNAGLTRFLTAVRVPAFLPPLLGVKSSYPVSISTSFIESLGFTQTDNSRLFCWMGLRSSSSCRIILLHLVRVSSNDEQSKSESGKVTAEQYY